jgi:hypothetical protein
MNKKWWQEFKLNKKKKQEQEFKNFTCNFPFANNWKHELKINLN